MKLLALTTWEDSSNGSRFTPRKNGTSAALMVRKRRFIRKPAINTCSADFPSANGPSTANCPGPE